MFKRFHGPEISGMGIGLAIGRKMAEAHHGFLEARSEEAIGATQRILSCSPGTVRSRCRIRIAGNHYKLMNSFLYWEGFFSMISLNFLLKLESVLNPHS